MSNIERWSPFRELDRMRELFAPGWFASFPWDDEARPHLPWGPAVDVRETKSEIIVHAEVPGVNPDDLEVTVRKDGLTLRGEVRHEERRDEGGYRRLERRYGHFHRTIPFPVAVKPDEARAEYRDGVLEVRAPKAQPEPTESVRLKVERPQGDRSH